jgi:hypothetical protein
MKMCTLPLLVVENIGHAFVVPVVFLVLPVPRGSPVSTG